MTADHYAEAERLLADHDARLALIRERATTPRAASLALAATAQLVAAAQAHAALALADAVRALKAGATVTTTREEVPGCIWGLTCSAMRGKDARACRCDEGAPAEEAPTADAALVKLRAMLTADPLPTTSERSAGSTSAARSTG